MLKKLAYLSPLALLMFQGCTSLMDGHLVAVDSYAPVSYTHLDVYKRQV